MTAVRSAEAQRASPPASGAGISPAVVDSDTIPAALRAAILRASVELESRRAALAAARARLGASGLAGPAVLAAEAEGVPDGIDLSRAQSVRVQAEREFLSGGRRTAARALAQSDVDAAQAALGLAEQRVAAVTDRALVALLGWSAIARRLADEDSLLASAEASLRARFAAGDARYVDVLRLRTERLRTQTDRAAAVVALQGSRRALEGLVDDREATAEIVRLAGAAAQAATVTTTFAPLPPAPDVDSLLSASGRLRLADAGVNRAVAAQALTLAEQRPRLAGFAGVQRFAADDGYPVGPVLGASISLPFTARRANRALAGAAAGDVAAATAERRVTLASLRAGAFAARDRYEAARERIAVYDAALLRGAREERESALASYRSGALSLVELLDFERALTRAETERLRNRIDAADALADLLAGVLGDGEPGSEHSPASPRLSSDDR